MQLAQLLRRDLRRRPHHQILGALVHREQRPGRAVAINVEQIDEEDED